VEAPRLRRPRQSITIARLSEEDAGRARAFAGVALVSLCVLMLQLTLTRLFSATMHYHFAFLAISLALFGSAASGVFVYLGQERLAHLPTGRALSAAAALFAATTAVALLVVLANPLSPVDPARTTLARLVRIYAATSLPFFFAGGVVTLAITRYASAVSRLYLFDLAGAAAGCLLLIPVLDALGAVDAVLAVAALAAAAAVLFERGSGGGTGYRGALAVLATGVVLLLAWNLATGRLDVRKAKGLEEEGNVIFSKWNSFSRVTVWGSLQNDSALIMIDADAATEVMRQGADVRRHAYLAGRIEALGWHLRPGARALILGPGGGNDVITARVFGAREVTAVEVNAIIARDLMSAEPLRSWTGALFEQPGVHLVVDEARSFIRGSPERYDLIQGTMVDTWAATAAGAFALTENHLYTVEAFRDYLAHLAPDGVLSLTRWYLEPPDQLLRLVSLSRAALGELGLDPAGDRIVIARGPTEAGTERAPATFLLKRNPFTRAEVERVEEVAARYGFALLYTPRSRPRTAFTRLIEAPDPRPVWAEMSRDLTPTRDNSPFFFHTARLRDLSGVLAAEGEWRKTNLGTFVLAGLLVLTTLATLAFVVGPLLLARGGVLRRSPTPVLGWLAYFACLGAGFIIVEVALVQKCILFLGHPTYALAVVLFSLLLFSGLGSSLSGRFAPADLRGRLLLVLGVVAALVVAASLALSPLFGALVHLARPWRIAVTVSALAPLGLAMGMPLPSAVRLLAREAPHIIPWAWGLNGAASVMGSVAALAIALAAGFNQALLVAAGLYVLALAIVLRLRPAREVDL
jgi:predicted membrane-bound spermidine synthase